MHKYCPEEVYREYSVYVKKCVSLLSRKYNWNAGQDDREDIEQYAWEKLFSGALERFRGDCRLGSYIYMVVRSAFIDHMKKFTDTHLVSGDSAVESLTCEDSTHDRMYAEDIKKETERILGNMSAEKQYIFMAVARDGYTQEQVARNLGITQSTVSEHLANVRRILRQELLKKFPESFN